MIEKPRLVGINHIVLEVGDLDAVLRGMGLELEKSESTTEELMKKGMA